MLEAIEQAIKTHDKYQVEVKLDYELLNSRKTRYRVSTYIFIPPTLGVTPNTYSKHDFYRDTQNYIRFKTPEMILRDLTEHSSSPLVTIGERVAQEGWASDARTQKVLVNSFKLLAAILKSSLREHMNLVYRRIEETEPEGKVHRLLSSLLEEFIQESGKITRMYRGFFPTFNLPNVDERVFAAFKFTDESISLLIEESATELYQIVDENLGKKEQKPEFKEALAKLIESEIQYRKSLGYRSIIKNSGEHNNEEFAYRTSALKKYASSVLVLATQRRIEGVGLQHIVFAAAAGISMLFATGAAFYFQQRLGNFTIPLLVALVIGYMFKDRIKEIGRGMFSTYLSHHLPDHRIIIRAAESRVKLGVLKQKVAFVAEKDVPNGVLKRRNRDPLAALESEGYEDYILLHSKEIVLYKKAFQRVFPGMPQLSGINDITRYDIRVYLRKMGDPYQQRDTLVDDRVVPVDLHRIYRLPFISKYQSVGPGSDKLYGFILLTLDRDGIQRVEHRSI
nr:hypothetical protein [Anaerolineae bacterium]